MTDRLLGPSSLDREPGCDTCLAVGRDLADCFRHLHTALSEATRAAPSLRKWPGVAEALAYLQQNGAGV